MSNLAINAIAGLATLVAVVGLRLARKHHEVSVEINGQKNTLCEPL